MIRAVALSTLLLSTPALAQDHASGDAIRSAISGNTVQGSMDASGGYTEYYAADGTILADGYEGAWAIEGDTMCFDYGEAEATCWNARIDGDQITWVVDGSDEGTGTILRGNPNDFQATEGR